MNRATVALVIEDPDNQGWISSAMRRPLKIRRMLPFWQTASRPMGYIHRIRSSECHFSSDDHQVISHTSVKLWCGTQSFVGLGRRGKRKGRLKSHLDGSGPACATCEARALAAGYGSNALVATYPIAYRPRI